MGKYAIVCNVIRSIIISASPLPVAAHESVCYDPYRGPTPWASTHHFRGIRTVLHRPYALSGVQPMCPCHTWRVIFGVMLERRVLSLSRGHGGGTGRRGPMSPSPLRQRRSVSHLRNSLVSFQHRQSWLCL